MKEIYLGIDFGTSNTSVATVLDGKIHLVPLQRNLKAQPSSVFLRADRYISTGFESIDDFLQADPIKDSFHFIPSIKQGLPVPNYEGVGLLSKKMVNGRFPITFFETEEIASVIINDVTRRASYLGKVSDHLVLGRPVRFSSNVSEDQLAQKRLMGAARKAGYSDVKFILEPVAAAVNYEYTHSLNSQKMVFVFDFGGGTLDTCVINLGGRSNDKKEVISSLGIDLGGTDLDKDVFKKHLLEYFGSQATFGQNNSNLPYHIFNELTEWHLISRLNNAHVLNDLKQIKFDSRCSDKEAVTRLIDLIQNQQVPGLLRSIEKAKIDLSRQEIAVIKYGSSTLKVKELISRSSFMSAIRPRIKEIETCINECLRLANVQKDRIDIVLRVGGSSKNKFVEEILRRNFNLVENQTELTSVAAGLGVAAMK